MFSDTSLSRKVSLGLCWQVSVGAEVRCMPISSRRIHGLNEDGITNDFHHNHGVLVASKRLGGELAGMVREHGFAYHVRLGVHVAHFLAVEVGGVACFQRRRLCFGRPYIFSCLVQMPLCSFDCLGVVFLGIAFSQLWPAHVVACFDGFEPS
jgi:hypothetical protein